MLFHFCWIRILKNTSGPFFLENSGSGFTTRYFYVCFHVWKTFMLWPLGAKDNQKKSTVQYSTVQYKYKYKFIE